MLIFFNEIHPGDVVYVIHLRVEITVEIHHGDIVCYSLMGRNDSLV